MWQVPINLLYCIFFIDILTAFIFLVALLKSKFRGKEIYKANNSEITFVLPAYNCGDILERTVKSIKNSDYPKNKIRIIIVDDASRDGTFEIAKKLSAKYGGVEAYTKNHAGKAEAVNFGIKKSKTAFVAVLDADTMIKRDLLKKAMSKFKDETSAAVTCCIKALNGNNFIERMQNLEYTFTGFYRTIMGKMGALPVAPAFTIFRKEFFLEHGYFDSNNMTEDFEMGLRIQSNHHNIGFVQDSSALTEVPSNIKSFLRQRLRWGYGTLFNCRKYRRLFFNKEYGDLGVFTMPLWFLGLLLISLVFLLGVYSFIYNVVHYWTLLSLGWTPNFNFNAERFMLSILDLKVMLFIFSIILGLTLFLIVHSEMRERIKLKDYILFVIIYLWIIAISAIISFAYFLAGRKPRW